MQQTLCSKEFIDAVGNKRCPAAACSCVRPCNAPIEPRQARCSVTLLRGRVDRMNDSYGPFAKEKDIIADDAKDC